MGVGSANALIRFDSTIPATSGTSRSKGSTAPGSVHCHLGSQFSRTRSVTFQTTFDRLIPGSKNLGWWCKLFGGGSSWLEYTFKRSKRVLQIGLRNRRDKGRTGR